MLLKTPTNEPTKIYPFLQLIFKSTSSIINKNPLYRMDTKHKKLDKSQSCSSNSPYPSGKKLIKTDVVWKF